MDWLYSFYCCLPVFIGFIIGGLIGFIFQRLDAHE